MLMSLEFEFPNVLSGCGVIDELVWSHLEIIECGFHWRRCVTRSLIFYGVPKCLVLKREVIKLFAGLNRTGMIDGRFRN